MDTTIRLYTLAERGGAQREAGRNLNLPGKAHKKTPNPEGVYFFGFVGVGFVGVGFVGGVIASGFA